MKRFLGEFAVALTNIVFAVAVLCTLVLPQPALAARVAEVGANFAATSTTTYAQQTSISVKVNEHRVYVHGLRPALRATPCAWRLSNVALAQAKRMAERRQIFHEDISGKVCPHWSWLGQNVGMICPGPLSSLFRAYHGSTAHRAVLQYRYANRQGDAAVFAGGCYWHVHNFGAYP